MAGLSLEDTEVHRFFALGRGLGLETEAEAGMPMSQMVASVEGLWNKGCWKTESKIERYIVKNGDEEMAMKKQLETTKGSY